MEVVGGIGLMDEGGAAVMLELGEATVGIVAKLNADALCGGGEGIDLWMGSGGVFFEI